MKLALVPFAEGFPPDAVRHHFAGQDQARGVYAKELRIPAGKTLVSHSHTYDHISILASGTIEWCAGDARREWLSGPRAIVVRAGVEHSLVALTEAVWFCVHPTDETDASRVDAVILRE